MATSQHFFGVIKGNKMKTLNTNTRERSLTSGYGLIQAFYWMAYAGSTSYTSIYLLDAGFSNTQIGILIALVSLISAFLQPVIAAYADKPTSPSLKTIVIAFSSLFTALAVVLLITGKRLAPVIILCYGGLIMINLLLMPLISALGMEPINQGKKLNFGLARGCGSIAFAIISYILGLVVASVGTFAAPVEAIMFSLLLIFVVYRFPLEKVIAGNTDPAKDTKKSGILNSLKYFFEHYRSFCFVLVGYVFICACHMLLNNFLYQVVSAIGGDSADTGTAMSLGAMVELPTMFCFGYLLKKASAATWYKVSSVFFVIKAVASLFAPNVLAFFGAQLLTVGAWALMAVASVYYVNSEMEKQDAVKGQACMTMAFTLGNVISALIGGPMIDLWGVKTLLISSIIMGAIGMVIVWANIDRKH